MVWTGCTSNGGASKGGGFRRVQESVSPLYDRTQTFRVYSSWLLPGILQIDAYTRAVLRALAQRRALANDVEEAVGARMQRQRVLHEGQHRFAIVLEESVLRTVIGGCDTMAAQLGHLIEVGSLPRVSLGIIPFAVDRTAMRPVEDFWIFDNEQVNVELTSAFLTITQPYAIAVYARTFRALSGFAVYGKAARSRITAAIAALEWPV